MPSSIVNSTSIRSPASLLERLEDVVELARELGQALGQRVERLGVAHAGDDVLALGVVEDLAVHLGRAGRRVAREGDAAARRLVAVEVAEHHRLHDAGGADRVVDAAELAVGLRARAVPRAEDRVDALLDLRARRLREVADQGEQRLRALAGGLPRLEPGGRGVEQRLLHDARGDAAHGGGEGVEQALVGAPGELGVTRVAGEALDDVVVEADVEDRVHHARHRDRRAGPHREQQRGVRVAELAVELLLELLQLVVDPLADTAGQRAVMQVLAADVGAEDEARRDRHPEADHLDEAASLAAEAVDVRLAGGVERDDGRLDRGGRHQ